MGEVGTREWAARRDAGGSARPRRGAGVSRVRERERVRPGPWFGKPACGVRLQRAVRAWRLPQGLLVRGLACCCAAMFNHGNKFYLSEEK